MTSEEFDNFVEGRVAKIRSVLAVKAKEYASDHDRLHNFHYAAEILNSTPARACVGFMTKHLVSVLDIVNDLDEGRYAAKEVICEKVGDLINYLILLEVLLYQACAYFEASTTASSRPKSL